MIRVNLLPQKREIRRDTPNQTWLLAVLGTVTFLIAALFLFHRVKLDELGRQQQINNELNSRIAQSKKTVADHADVKAQLEALRAREEAIGKLQTARTGPTAVLIEVAQVLTRGRGPTVDQDVLAQLRRDNPSAVFNLGWDSRRLWLTSYQENDRLVRIEGLARDADDVSELARRLTLSKYFTDVKLMPASRTFDSESKLELLKFELQAKARY